MESTWRYEKMGGARDHRRGAVHHSIQDREGVALVNDTIEVTREELFSFFLCAGDHSKLLEAYVTKSRPDVSMKEPDIRRICNVFRRAGFGPLMGEGGVNVESAD